MLRTSWFWIVLAIGSTAVLAAGLDLERWGVESPRARLEAGQQQLRELRAHLDACLRRLDEAQERFWAHESHTHRLRSRIDEFESLDPAGVPADRYDEYLEVFDGFNEAIPVWEARADSVRAQQRRCNGLVERYNEERDGLRLFLQDEGYWEALEPRRDSSE